MSRFRRSESEPGSTDPLCFDVTRLANINQQLGGLTDRVQPDNSSRRVGLFNLLKFEGSYYDRTGGFVSGNDKRVRVWLGEASKPVTGTTLPYNVAVIEHFEDDTRMTLNLDTGSYDYDIHGLHVSQIARHARQAFGPDARSDIELGEDGIYRTFFYGLSDAGSPEGYRDTGAPK